MSDSASSLRRKISSAGELQSVVRTMKTLAASSIGQYERAVLALSDYARTVDMGLGVCFRANSPGAAMVEPKHQRKAGTTGIVVFGSDQGLVGQFNEIVAEYAIEKLAALPGNHRVWAVGERVHERLADSGVPPVGLFDVPSSVEAITRLVGEILVATDSHERGDEAAELHLIYNRPTPGSGAAAGGAYSPFDQRLLPLDEQWRNNLAATPWPAKNVPQVMGDGATTLRGFIREYLFVSLFRACAESLASENASRLAAMQRADKNIDDLLEGFKGTFHRVRQAGIDEELFDVVAGFEALSSDHAPRSGAGVRKEYT